MGTFGSAEVHLNLGWLLRDDRKGAVIASTKRPRRRAGLTTRAVGILLGPVSAPRAGFKQHSEGAGSQSQMSNSHDGATLRSSTRRSPPHIKLMKSTILAVILIVAAGAANAQNVPGLAGNAGRMPETMSPGIQPSPSMPAPTPAPSTERYPESYSQGRSTSEPYDMREIPRGGSDGWSAGATEYASPHDGLASGMGHSEGGMSASGRK